MMDNKEYESSDVDDSDFKPDDEFSDDSAPSECASEVDEDDSNDQEGEKLKKKKSIKNQKKKTNKSRKRKRKKISANTDEEDESITKSDNEDNTNKLTPEEEKERADSLWKSFLNDTAIPSKSQSSNSKTTTSKVFQDSKTDPNKKESILSTEKKHDKVDSAIIEITTEKCNDNIASGTSKITKISPASSTKLTSENGNKLPPLQNNALKKRGLSSILSNINKKPKLSTLEKSKLDWNQFKQENNLTEEINTFNRGKNGYLEKQDFLQRTDLKRFEIEKELRNVGKRKLR